MRLPLRLTPRAEPARTDAVVIFTDAAADVLRVAGDLGPGWPEVYRVAGGFVLIPAAPVPGAVPGAVRLRRLAGSLFVPADADLRPTLLASEALSLTRTQGLVLLPQVTALSFDPEVRLREADFLTPPARSLRAWMPLPTAPTLPRELTVIQAKLPENPAAILEVGEPDGTSAVSADPKAPVPEGARPPGAGFGATVAARAKLGVGRLLNSLGRNAGLAGLAALGSILAKSALEAVPRLTETVLGKQEGALREILRQLERGNIEEALRRAPPAVADPDAPKSRIDGGSSLGLRNAAYSLASLLGGGADAVGWLGTGDVWAQLAQNYRKLAEDAARRGDARRAAYLYGVLLRDVRSAANALAAGGLNRDAAILYRDKLKDLPRAAAEFEKAGDFDEALRLYLQLNQYEPAAELMRRLGDEGRAVGLFLRAADMLATKDRHAAAGDLVRDKVGDLTRAELYYFVGWHHAGPGQMVCAERMIDLHAAGERWAELATLIDRAETRFAPPHTEEASRFFELVLRQEAAMPPGFRDDVRDQARLHLAGHLREHATATPGGRGVVSQVFGGRAGWSASLVQDANVAVQHAAAARPKSPAEPDRRVIRMKLVTGPVTAAVATPSGSVVVAGLHGETQRYVSPTVGVETVQGVDAYHSAGTTTVVALATDPEAKFVVNLTWLPDASCPLRMHSFWKREGGKYRFASSVGLHVDESLDHLYLQPELDTKIDSQGVSARVALFEESWEYDVPVLRSRTANSQPNLRCQTHFAVRHRDAIWNWDAVFVNYSRQSQGLNLCHSMPWTPGLDHPEALSKPPVSWLTPSAGTLEVAGVNRGGSAWWSRLSCEDRTLTGQHAQGKCAEGYVACCLVAPGRVVGVTAEGRVVRLRPDGKGGLGAGEFVARIVHPTRAVFVAYQPAVREVVVVFSDGWMARVRI